MATSIGKRLSFSGENIEEIFFSEKNSFMVRNAQEQKKVLKKSKMTASRPSWIGLLVCDVDSAWVL